MKSKLLKCLLCGSALLNLSACSVIDQWLGAPSEPVSVSRPTAQMPTVLPVLQDYPDTFNVYQRIRVETDRQFTGDQPTEFEAMITANRKNMKIALMAMGMKVWSIDYDGMVITEERGEQVPETLQVQYLMRDIALVYWPASSLKGQLKDWKLVENASGRQIFAPDSISPAVTITYQNSAKERGSEGNVILENHLHHYRLMIQSSAVK